MVNRSIQAKLLKMKRRGKHRIRSRALINTGHVSEYNGSLRSLSNGHDPLPQSKIPVVLRDLQVDQKIIMIDDHAAKLSLFFKEGRWVFVEEDKRKKSVRRSIVYSNKRIALSVMSACCITWVEQLPTVKAT